ncbi:MAG: hypothetical protein RLZZ387_871 [Chloroflexota bacterium]
MSRPRTLSLMATMMVLLAMLVSACGQSTAPSSSNAPTTAPAAEAPATDAPTAAAEATTAPATEATAAPAEGAAAAQPVADLGGRTLVIGSDTTYPPMEFVDDNRQIVGFDVDMMNEIGKLINAEVEFRTFPSFDAIFAALANKEFDMVVSAVSVTEERKQIIAFSDPYLSIGQVISVPVGSTTIASVADLTSVELVGVQGGTTGEQAALEAGVPAEKIKRYDTIDLAFQDLANGAVDAVVADGPPSARYTQQLSDKIMVAGEPFTTEDYAIALQQGDEELLTAVNAALAELKANGTLEQLMEKWNLADVANLP